MASVRPPYKATRVHRTMSYYRMCLKLEMMYQNFPIKHALPLYFYMLTCARDLLYSRNRVPVSFRHRIPTHCTDVMVGWAL